MEVSTSAAIEKKVESKKSSIEDNPFAYDTPLTFYEVFKIIFLIVTGLMPLRCILLVINVFLCFLVSYIATIGLEKKTPDVDEKPLSPWRRKLLRLLPFLARGFLFIYGFWTIKVKGKIHKDAAFIVPNHVGFFDIFSMFWLSGGCTAVGKAEIFNIPFFSSIFTALQIIPVQRESTESRMKTKLIMKRYADSQKLEKSKQMPKILIFPEGTTHRSNVVLMFQKGAFVFGVPVQPVAINYPYKHFNPCWTVSRWSHFYKLRTFCQFKMSMTIEVLPLHRPTAAEKLDPSLFANNVRLSIASALSANVSEHWYEDIKLYSEAVHFKEKLDFEKIRNEVKRYIDDKQKADKERIERLSQATDLKIDFERTKPVINAKSQLQGRLFYLRRMIGLLFDSSKPIPVDLSSFQMQEVKNIFNDRRSHFDEISFLLKNFVLLDEEGVGVLEYKDFCSVLGLQPENPQSKNLFSFFDTNQIGKINFRQVALGLAYCSSEVNNEQKRKLAFNLLDVDGDGQITWSQFGELFVAEDSTTIDGDAVEKIRLRTEQILRKITGEADGNEFKVTWSEFDKLTQEEPSVVNYILAKNNTGWTWNIKKTMQQLEPDRESKKKK